MKIRKIIVALAMSVALISTAACGAQDGCYDDGERVSCYDDDDREDDDDEEWDDD